MKKLVLQSITGRMPRAAQNRFSQVASCAFVSMLAGTAAFAQNPEATLEEVVITGTSIRGAAPVGSNLITVGREEIEESGAQTLQQILSAVPAVTGFGNSAQGGFQSFDGAATFAPTIHGLGGSASNGTLVLVDGHRLPLSGINHTLADPNVIAPLAIERVEVLPDGASSTYGSDAVAGVLNFITRRNYQGFEASGQAGFGDGYSTKSAGFLWGDTWENGSVLLTYGYSTRSALKAADRSFTRADHLAQGGGNFANFNCSPATVSPAAGQPGAGLIFTYPYTGTGIANTANNSNCDYSNVADLLPKDDRHNLLIKIERQVNDNLKLSTDVVWAKQTATAKIARGSVQATVFNAGNANGQGNPFFAAPTGVTSATVRFQADDLLGPGAQTVAGADALFATFGAEYKLGGDWQANLGSTIGKDDSRQRRNGALCVSCALLALNGTTNIGGSPTAPSVPGTTTAVLGFPLTSANALDVWSPPGSNRTSAAVLARLVDSTQLQIAHQTITNITLKLDGTLFELPGGNVRAAFGGEYVKYTMREELTRERGTGPASSNSSSVFIDLGRDVTSGYAEVLVPLVGAGNAIPLVHKLDINLSGRYDRYSDFGSTTNPKMAFSWGLTPGLTVRGNVARSFTAPALTSRGDATGRTAESNFGGLTGATGAGVNANQTIPINFPGASGLPAGACSTVTNTCTINSSTVQGISIAGGNKDLKPQKGKTFSVGIDFAPEAVPGLTLSGTFWDAQYLGAITAPQAVFALASPDLNSALILNPTPAQIAVATAGLPQNSATPTTVSFIYSFQQRNAFDLLANGIDADVRYQFETGIGRFNAGVSVSRKLKMDQRFGSGGQTFSVLNTIGLNTTFPSNKMSGRASFGWARDNISADVFFNYTGSYTNMNGSAPFPVIRNASFLPVGGGQPIPSYSTVDMHFAYDFEGDGMLAGMQVSVDGSNLLDKEPPFVNTALGYDGFNASPIGRVITLGLSKKW